MRTPRTLVLAAVLLLPLGATACSNDDDPSAEVATLGGTTETTAPDDSATGGGPGGATGENAAFEDAMLEFAECMRDHGIDFPDPRTDEGGFTVVGPGGDGPPSEAERQELEAAQQACQSILDDARSELPPIDPQEQEEMREQALAFAECMREHGVDMPDPTFGDDGSVGIRVGPAEGGPAMDLEDPDFQAAQDACGGEGGGFRIGPRDEDDE